MFNCLDCFIVIVGWIAEVLDHSGLSALRALRAFRLPRFIGQVRGMRVFVETIVKSGPALCNVVALLAFTIIMFSIMGVQLFAGSMNQRCYITTDIINNVTYYELDASREARCSSTGSMLIFTGWPCFDNTTCLEPTTWPSDGSCLNDTDCPYTGRPSAHGILLCPARLLLATSPSARHVLSRLVTPLR